MASMDEDVEAVSRLVAVEGDYHGHDGMRRWWANVLDAFPDYSLEVLEVRDLGDSTLSDLRGRGHGASSDVPFEQKLWHLVEWRGEKVTSWRSFETEAEALEAAGLSD
jgi:hypothetical protein